MVKRVLLTAALVALVLVGTVWTAAATTYLFEVPSMTVDLWPQTDGALKVRYKIAFRNLSSDPLDIVDIGTPDKRYDLSTFTATLNGVPLDTIRPSTYVTGVEVPLAPFTIKPNRSGTLVVEFAHPRLVYEDNGDDAYTSVEFGNTYFGSDYVQGATALTINWHLPNGVTGNETKWHGNEPTTMGMAGGHLVFTYKWPDASAAKMYKTGIGFPARIMQEGAIRTHTWADSCLELVAAAFGVAAACGPGMLFALIALSLVIWRLVMHRRRLKQYLPPSIGIEGAGPKRGLTAPEAAVTLELPPDKVLMMILFGLIKKGALTVTKHDPLRLKPAELQPSGLRAYETSFLEAINKDGGLSQRRLKTMFVAMIKAVNTKLKGFSRKETRDYYRQIIDNAWQMVETAATPDIGGVFAEQAVWLAADGDFGQRAQRTFRDRQVVVFPHWWGAGWGYSGQPTTPGGGFSVPGAGWATDFTQSLTNFSNTVVDSVTSFTQSVTQITNPPPVSSSGGGGGGGGGGCACACACAGCACACAGGGR